MESIKKILNKLPSFMQHNIQNLSPEIISNFEEIRIKVGYDTLVICSGDEINLNDKNYVTQEVLEEILNRLLDYSYYAYEEQLSRGYITIEGGHRVGICGRVTLKEDKVHLIKDISSLNIRRCRQIVGVASKVIKSICNDDKRVILNTLIISPPKCGKTTILRDIARILSNDGYRVAICDERSEIAGCHNGVSSFDIGARTDVLDGCPKAEGIMMLIRAMSPDVIITDEIGKDEDIKAIQTALSAGVKTITSIHGDSLEDIQSSVVRELVDNCFFDTLIFLSQTPAIGTVKRIMKLNGMKKGA